MRRLAFLACVAACGESASAPDASGPAADAIPLPACELDDHAFIAASAKIRPSTEGHDLDGDGDIDNVAGPLGPFVNPAVATQIADGVANLLWILPGLRLPPGAEPNEVLVYNTGGIDADVPPDSTNNLDGGEFLVTLADLQADCTPREPGVTIQDGTHLSGTAEHGTFVTPSGLAESFHIVIEADLEPDGSAMHAVNSGVVGACGADRLPAPGTESGTVLGFAVVLGIQPDFDLDGDGLETIDVENGVVARCHDGSGAVIEGIGCGCDPAIADGFSFSFEYDFVPAQLVGVIPP